MLNYTKIGMPGVKFKVVPFWNLLLAQSCKGICKRFEAPTVQNKLRYSTGQKRCSYCNCFFITEKLACMCCKTRLRIKSRNRKTRNKILNP